MKPQDQELNDAVVAEDIISIYNRLATDRQEYLDRARENALVTIPHLMPPEGTTPGSRLSTPYQSVGSQGVNTLTAKLTTTLIPPNTPMFRFSVSDSVVAEMAEDPDQRGAVEQKLNEIERTVMDEIEGLGCRSATTEGLRQIIVCGNVLFYLPKKGGLKMYKLDRYVCQRDFEGNILMVIIKETVSKETLSQATQKILANKIELPSDKQKDDLSKNEVDVYTVFERKDDMIMTYQQIKGIKLPNSMGRWPVDRAPIMALRWTAIPGEDYGRAYVDEYIGDLTAVEKMSKNIREGIAAMTKINPMVNPTGLTKARDVAQSENLEVIAGRKDDVTMLQMEKTSDLRFAAEYLNTIIGRIQVAFMMNKSAQRDAERVTAEEIRQVIGDIDDTLGGIYSLLAVEYQKPLVLRIIHRMENEKKIPKITSLKGSDGKQLAMPKVVTGIEALGRGQDYQKYRTFMMEVIMPLKEAGLMELNIPDLIKRAATSLNIDPDGLIKSMDQKKQETQEMQAKQQQMQQAQMMQDAVKGGAGPVAKVAAEGMAEQIKGAQADGTDDIGQG